MVFIRIFFSKFISLTFFCYHMNKHWSIYLFSPAKLLLIHRFSKKIIITYCVVGKNRYLCVLLRVALFY